MKVLSFLLLWIPLAIVAQDSDSLCFRASHRVLHATVLPVSLIVAGVSVSPYNQKINNFFVSENQRKNPAPVWKHVADHTVYVPALLVYGLSLGGVKGKHRMLKSTSLLLQSELVVLAFVVPLKTGLNKPRPDGGSYSFPSGHTAQAFMTATFLHKELGHRSIWFSIAGYSLATTVGVCRMVSNRHWMSDVLAGAGIGILSTNLVYLVHRHRPQGKHQVSFFPAYNRGPGLYASIKF